jgi:hypothetical protein
MIILLFTVLSVGFSSNAIVFYTFTFFVVFRAAVWTRTGLAWDEPVAALNIATGSRDPFRQSKRGSSPSEVPQFMNISSDRGVSWDESTRQKYRYVFSLPKPRPIQLSDAGQKAMSVGLIVVTVFVLVAGLSIVPNMFSKDSGAARLADFGFVVFIIIFASVIVIALREQFQNRLLLSQGEGALGRIISQYETGAKTRRSRIAYVYQLPSGTIVEGSGTDLTRTLLVGMPVPIFYDRDHPAHHIAENCSYWEIVPSVVLTQRS